MVSMKSVAILYLYIVGFYIDSYACVHIRDFNNSVIKARSVENAQPTDRAMSKGAVHIDLAELTTHPSIWPRGNVFYTTNDGGFSKTEINTINRAMQAFSEKTCIIFKDVVNFSPVIDIRKTKDTKVIVGRRIVDSGVVGQLLLLTEDDLGNEGNIIHLLMHEIGFFHEEQAWDRDEYVEIIWDNIESKHLNKFMKMSKTEMPDYGIEYDYNSIMHSPGDAYSKNGKDTIIPKNQDALIGQRDEMSEGDLFKIARMYATECYQLND